MKSSGIGIGCAAIVAFLALVLGITLFGAFIFMVVWNVFIAGVFGGPELSLWQALAGWLLIGIIGGAFRGVTNVSRS